MKKLILITIFLFVLLYISILNVRPMFTPDETRYAEVPREMIESGNWVVPKLDGFRYFEKPAMGYWLDGLSMLVFGFNAFAIRFPSALAAGISALMLFFFSRRQTGSPGKALLSSVIFLTCLLVYFIGTFNVLDTMLTMFLTIAIILFFFAIDEKKLFLKISLLALFGAFCGCAFLVKGFLGFAVPIMIIVPYMFWVKRWKELLWLPWIPVLFALIVSLPWAIMIAIQEPDYWHYFIYVQNIQRFLSASEAEHPEPFFYFIPVLLAGALPWTVLFPSAFSGLKKIGFRSSPFMKYLLCWLIIPFIFFSISRGKLATYILPCFAPLSILLSIGLFEYFKRDWKKSFNIGTYLLAGILLIGSIGLLVARFWDIPYGKGENLKLTVCLVGLLFWVYFLILSAKASKFYNKIIYFCIAPLVLMFVASFAVPDMVLVEKAPGTFFERNSYRIKDDSKIVAYGSIAGPAAWFLKRDDIYILHKTGELAYGLKYNDSKDRLLSYKELKKFVKENKNVVVIMEHKDKREAYVPKGKSEDVQGDLYFIQF